MQLPTKYTDIKELAPGQNASVFSARDTLLDRKVFLKAYKIPEDDPNSALREPQMLEALAHQNLTKIYSADKLPGDYLLLGMELVEGGSYKDIIDDCVLNREWISTHRVLSLVADAAGGLGHLHCKQFVHRDVKPANLMRRQKTASDQGVVTDLGLASRLNQDGKVYASRHARLYRPPETWVGHGYTPSSDIYQLGIVLYQMLGGHLDYTLGKLPDDKLGALVVANQLLDYTSLPPHMSKSMLGIIKKCVCSVSGRFKEMSELIVELHNLRNKEPDWSCKMLQDGMEIIRADDNARTTKFVVRMNGQRHEIQREKKVGGGNYRRNGQPVVINHKQLSSCQRFKALLNE